MAGRSIRQARPNQRGNSDGVESTEGATRIDTGIVQLESTDDIGEDRGEFIATDDAQTVTDYDLPIEPTSITDSGDRPRTRRRRADAGQPRGTRRQKAASFSSQGNLEKFMLSVHMMGAAFLKMPELRIDAEESALLSKASLDFMKAYGVPELTDKQLALGQLVMALGTVYVPRVMIVSARRGQKPKLVPNTIPFPSAAQQVQQAQPPITQPAPTPTGAPQPNTYGATPVAPPLVPEACSNGYVSSSVFAAETGTDLGAINAS